MIWSSISASRSSRVIHDAPVTTHTLNPAAPNGNDGWYAGAVGWTDLAEDGEFCVALRCALLRGRVAHLYAGCGIVRDSVPAEELAESDPRWESVEPLKTLSASTCEAQGFKLSSPPGPPA